MPRKYDTPMDVLVDAHHRLGPPQRYATGASAYDAMGERCAATSLKAVRWDAIGVVYRAGVAYTFEATEEALYTLLEVAGTPTLAMYADQCNHQAAVLWLGQAIVRRRARIYKGAVNGHRAPRPTY